MEEGPRRDRRHGETSGVQRMKVHKKKVKGDGKQTIKAEGKIKLWEKTKSGD